MLDCLHEGLRIGHDKERDSRFSTIRCRACESKDESVTQIRRQLSLCEMNVYSHHDMVITRSTLTS